MFNLLVHELKSRWKGVVGWGIGLTLFGAMYISVWPEAGAQMIGLADLSLYQALGFYMGSFEEYLGSVVILFLPILLGIYAIVTGTKAIAGEEEAGTLELLMARPLSRWQIVVTKAVAIGIAMIAILFLGALGDAAVLAGLKVNFETSLMPMSVFRALFTAWPIVMAFAMISLFLGAFMPSRRLATVIATLILIASYLGENIAGMVESLDGVKPFSLFTYYDSSAAVFTQGAATSDVLVLLGVAVVFFALALVSFQQRNVTVGAWPWQRGRIPADG
jgi:beta-exotoxin I transport system permease protein